MSDERFPSPEVLRWERDPMLYPNERDDVYTCPYKDCYVPASRHNVCAAAPVSKCWGKLEHQHHPRRSAGGKRCDVMLCSAHHGSVDQGLRYEGRRLLNTIADYGDGREYRIYDRTTGERLVRVPLEEKHE